jgi:hypothetical protein
LPNEWEMNPSIPFQIKSLGKNLYKFSTPRPFIHHGDNWSHVHWWILNGRLQMTWLEIAPCPSSGPSQALIESVLRSTWPAELNESIVTRGAKESFRIEKLLLLNRFVFPFAMIASFSFTTRWNRHLKLKSAQYSSECFHRIVILRVCVQQRCLISQWDHIHWNETSDARTLLVLRVAGIAHFTRCLRILLLTGQLELQQIYSLNEGILSRCDFKMDECLGPFQI